MILSWKWMRARSTHRGPGDRVYIVKYHGSPAASQFENAEYEWRGQGEASARPHESRIVEHNPLASPSAAFLPESPQRGKPALRLPADFPYCAGDSAPAQRIAEANRVIANSVRGLIPPAEQHDHRTTALRTSVIDSGVAELSLNVDESAFTDHPPHRFIFFGVSRCRSVRTRSLCAVFECRRSAGTLASIQSRVRKDGRSTNQ